MAEKETRGGKFSLPDLTFEQAVDRLLKTPVNRAAPKEPAKKPKTKNPAK